MLKALNRQFTARAADRLGFTSTLERLTARPRLVVLNYHRIGDARRTPFDRALFSATADELDAQMMTVRRRYHIASLDEVVQFVENPSTLRRTVVAVTFDDGYRDNYRTAFPILRRYRVPATFFVVTGWMGSGRIPWWDAVAFMVRHTTRTAMTLRYPAPETIAIPATDRNSTIREVLRICKSPAVDSIARFVDEVSKATDVELPRERSGGRRFLSWDEAREMRDAGMTFGSHTHDHPVLAKLPYQEQANELRVSAALLRRELGVERPTLAFPVGSSVSYNDDSAAALRDAEYRGAFTFTGSTNRVGCRRFSISRVAIDGIEPPLLRFRIAASAFGSWRVPL